MTLADNMADAATPFQGGMGNDKLREAWNKKLPGTPLGDREFSAFAVGVEVGYAHARDLELQDWSRIHHALKDAGVHPGRTDDHLADVIASAFRKAREEREALARALLKP